MHFELLKLMKTNKIDAKIIEDQKVNALILSSLKTEFSKLIFNMNGKFFEGSFADKMIEASLK